MMNISAMGWAQKISFGRSRIPETSKPTLQAKKISTTKKGSESDAPRPEIEAEKCDGHERDRNDTDGELVPVGLAFTAATFPSEWLDENGMVDYLSRRRKSLFSNTLVLPRFDALEAEKIVDPKKLDAVQHMLILDRRHLENAIFDFADLRKIELNGAQLQGALLRSAQLQSASLRSAGARNFRVHRSRIYGSIIRSSGRRIWGQRICGARSLVKRHSKQSEIRS